MATPLTYTVDGFREVSGMSRNNTYKLIKSGLLDTAEIGGRRLIVAASYQKLIEAVGDGRGVGRGTNSVEAITERWDRERKAKAARSAPKARRKA